jgi:tetratricopeptide (TPR) repeat protein
MSFDKIKAMRNAERFLSQGKIRAAISEYKRIVEADPKDFGTLNILGDLYLKNAESTEAVGCFTQVAEHYNKQGFSQKAIAVYNKISRLQPGSMEVSAKLAQLYQLKGSYSEARTHYTALAEECQRKGLKVEALEIWKQIAELDPHDTRIYLKIADIYWQENQKDDAAKAFTEAGLRL